MSSKIAVAYRIYPGISKKPAYFSDDKRKMAELCFFSLIKALGNCEYHIWVILDNCPVSYEDIFTKHCLKEKLTFIHDKGIGNALTFEHQLNILLEQQFSDIIMFAEDDYFYLKNAVQEGVDFLQSRDDVDFVTLFDHKNYYDLPLHLIKGEKISHNDREWKTVNSTCLTFITRKKSIKDTLNIFLTYKQKNYDASIWLAITKLGVWSKALWREALRDKLHRLIIIKLFLFSPLRVLFGKSKQLWCPYPTLATHMESEDLAPEIDWQKEFQSASKAAGIE